jgi:uroporphyrinogen III methyltransferase/synthase
MPGLVRRNTSKGERPLAGLRIVLTRPREQAADFEARILALGGQPEIAPAIAIARPEDLRALDAALDDIGRFDWIVFTSANAVRALAGRARERGIPAARLASPKIGAVGTATAGVLAEELRAPDAIARTATAKSLGSELPVSPGTQVLVPHGNLADGALAGVLRVRGAVPHEILAYRTVPGEGVARIAAGVRAGEIDALLFASGSAVRFVAGALQRDAAGAGEPTRAAIFCIGPSTARAAVTAGLFPDGVASVATQHALIDAAVHWFADRRGGGP